MRIIDIAYMRLSARVAYVRPWELKYFNFFQRTGGLHFNLANQDLVFQKSTGQQYNTIKIFPLIIKVLLSAHSGLKDDTTIFNDRMEISIRGRQPLYVLFSALSFF